MKPASITSLLLRDFRHHARAMALVALAIALAVAAVAGALLTGASVRGSLAEMVGQRLGQVQSTLAMPQGTFRKSLLQDQARTAPLLRLPAHAATPEASGRLWLQGVDQSFFRLAPDPQAKTSIAPGELWLNAAAATLLKAKPGDTIVLRLKRPSALSGDFMMASPKQTLMAMRMPVAGILPAAAFGDFSLESNQRPIPAAFANLEWLAKELEIPGQANLLVSAKMDAAGLEKAVRKHLSLEDLGCRVEEFPEAGDVAMVRSNSGFLPDSVLQAAKGVEGCRPIFTWFVNAIAANGKETPFSFVCGDSAIVPDRDDNTPFVRRLVASAWLAEDLGLKPGDKVKLRYFAVGDGPELLEDEADFTVAAILPPPNPSTKRLGQALMPEFPGLAEADHCSDWDAELPIDLKKVRKQDEAYWDEWRGTPKAFVSRTAARGHWGSRLGQATALLMPRSQVAAFEANLRNQLAAAPTLPGMQAMDLRKMAAGDAVDSVDFASLFLGLSFFFIVAALLLAGLALGFFLENRQPEIGTLRAIGLPELWIQSLLLVETGAIAIPGVLLGLLLGIAWCQLVLWNLNSLWIGAVGTSSLTLHAPLSTLALAGGIGLTLALALTLATTRRFLRQSIRSLTDELPPPESQGRRRLRLLGSAGLVSGGLVAAFSVPLEGDDAMGGFIACGTLALVGVFGLLDILIRQPPTSLASTRLSLSALAWRNLQRRRRRSLAVAGLLALGLFLTVAVGINQKGMTRNPGNRHSGTGGFSLCLETTLPLHQDLNQATVRQKLGIPEAKFVPFRVAAGGAADCQNLNRVSMPQIIACDPQSLITRDAFVFKTVVADPGSNLWPALLQMVPKDGSIPVVADMNAITWILKKRVGDTLEYPTPSGTVKLWIVGGLENSILQGSLIMSEWHFLRLYPKADGYQLLLAETTPGQEDALAQALRRTFGAEGASVETTASRLNRINLVQNTYLQIFLALGGLGILLGILGASLLLRRNLHERRTEFAWMAAAGFSPAAILRLLWLESSFLVAGGILAGTLAATLVMIPVWRSASGEIPWLHLGLLYLALCLGIVLCNALVLFHALRQTPPSVLAEE